MRLAAPSLAALSFAAALLPLAACPGGSSTPPPHADAGTTLDASADTAADQTADVTSPPSDAGDAADSLDSMTGDAPPAAAFPFPPVVGLGGDVLAAPRVVTVTFPGDPLAADLAQLGATLTSSAYWDTVRKGYCALGTCIGDGPAGVAAAQSTPPGPSYDDVPGGAASSLKTFLAGLISGGQVPAPDASTIYVLYFPKATSLTFAGAQSCSAFHGYHSRMTLGSQRVVYAVVPECDPVPQTPPETLLESVTSVASHEIAEASSDPGGKGIGFALDPSVGATRGWADLLGSEIADLCVDPFALGQQRSTDGPYTVARIWSALEASSGRYPCVPRPAGEVYFAAFPAATVVTLDVGQSTTIGIDALADGAMGSWTVTAEDWTDPTTQPYLQLALAGGVSTDAGSSLAMKSGDHASLTVTLLADPANAPAGEADAVLVSADASGGTVTRAHFWPFVVLTPAEAADAGVHP